MLKGIFPRRSNRQSLEHPNSNDGNFLKKSSGEGEVINKFWLVNYPFKNYFWICKE